MSEQNKKKENLPQYALDIIDADNERRIRWLWIATFVLFIFFVASNMFWVSRNLQRNQSNVREITITTISNGGATGITRQTVERIKR